MKVEAFISHEPWTRTTSLFIIGTEGGRNWQLVPREDQIVMEYLDTGQETAPFMKWSGLVDAQFTHVIQAIVEAAGKEGIFAVASHRDQIKAEAIAAERADVISHEREQFADILGRVLGNNVCAPPHRHSPCPTF